MRIIRKIVYWVGLRPKPGSIFYSPSRAWTLAAQEGLKEVSSTFEEMRDAIFRDWEGDKDDHWSSQR